MQGNEVGDRAHHNFFAQENFFHGGYLPSDNDLWVSTQKQIGLPSFHTKDYGYDPEQSEVELRHNGLHFPVSNGFNFMQETATAEFTKDQSQGQHQFMNAHMYGCHVLHPGPNEAIFLGLDNNVNQRGFLVNELQQGGACVSEPIPDSNRSYEIDAHGSLNCFGGQHQMMNSQHPEMLQQVQQQQQSGFGDINLKRQLMLRKMQEIQRQKEMQRLNTSQQHGSVNQASPFAGQASSGNNGSRGLINGTPSSVGFVHQQVDQSLFGVPVSSPRGPLNSCSYAYTDEASTQQMPIYLDSSSGNQYAGIPEISLFGNMSDQGSNSWIKMEQIQQLTSVDLIGRSQMAQDEPAIEASHVAASLDPDEESFLFGSDENIWYAFSSDGNDNNEFASGVPSIQSGSWSALMQSAVAEASGSGIIGFNFQNLEHPSTYEDSGKQQAPLPDVNRLNAAGNQLFGSSLPHNKLNVWTPVESILNPRDRAFNTDENDYSMQQSRITNHTRVIMHGEIDQRDGIRRVNAHPNSIVDPESTNTSMSSPQISGEGASHFGQFPINSRQLNYWKHVESSVRSKGTGNLGICSQVSESSFNKEDLKMHEIRSKRENSNDSYQSSSSCQVTTTARLRESSAGGNLRAFAHMKFQYHPMGNLDEVVEMPYGKIQSTNTQPLSLQHYQRLRGQGNLGHTNISGQVPKSSAKMGKGQNTTEKMVSSRGHGLRNNCDNGSPNRRTDETLNGPHKQLNLRKSSQLNVVENRGNLCRKVDLGQTTNGPPHKDFHANPTTIEIDLKAFGRSLKPNNSRQNYSSMNEKRAIGNTDNDPCNRVTKRLKVSDNLLPMDACVQHRVALRPKKRKLTTTAGLHPWFVEVSGSFKNLQGICTGAGEWSGATNRPMEKVDDDGYVTEDVPRSKRRLILSTLLMQQLFRPPLDSILSADGGSVYESAVYYVGRLALGDACNLVSFARSYSGVSVSGANGLSDQSKESERNDDRRLPEAVEDFMSKARKLEDSFSRLDKITSVVDLKVEFQDLQRFSIINQLARFHGRIHAIGSETSSTIFPRRYVTPFALPTNLPDRVRCLSL